MDNSLDDRLIAVEIRLAHYEHLADEMSDVLAAQARTIDALTAQLRALKERQSDMAAGWDRSPQDDQPPPHY